MSEQQTNKTMSVQSNQYSIAELTANAALALCITPRCHQRRAEDKTNTAYILRLALTQGGGCKRCGSIAD